MQLLIRVIPNAKKEEIVEEDGVLKVKVRQVPEDGKANAAVIKMLAKHYGVKARQVTIVKGEKSRQKMVVIEEKTA